MAQPILPAITSHLPYDVQSLLPRQSSEVSPLPQVNSEAPSLKDQGVDYSESKAWIVACVRHPGCPFAEKEAKDLSAKLESNESLSVVIVQHSEGEELKEWAKTVGFGIGQMGYSGLFSSEMFNQLKDLRSKGIKNTQTGSCSNRWQNSGSFAINSDGIVKWRHLAEHAGDMADFDEAFKSLGI